MDKAVYMQRNPAMAQLMPKRLLLQPEHTHPLLAPEQLPGLRCLLLHSMLHILQRHFIFIAT